MKKVIRGARAMERFAENLAKRVRPAKRARVIALSGDLGTGKTTFVRGFARGLHLRRRITSPTFLIARSYKLSSREKFERLYHLDLYRIKHAKELRTLRIAEILENPKHIVLIEWADLFPKLIPRSALWIRMSHGRKSNERTVASASRGW